VASRTGQDVAVIGGLRTQPAAERPDLLAGPVAAAVAAWPVDVLVTEIDPALADTAALCTAYDVPPGVCANCVVVAGARAGQQRVAACLVLATTRADVNRTVRRRLDVRKASFLAMDEAVTRTGMEYGGITAPGLPAAWPVLVDAAVVDLRWVVIGSGLRRSKLVVPGAALAALPAAVVVPGLGLPA
jgi:prolyl-tRNA editing enzyme YbaK/EbsC (Cys-tRNA(Pro) deacylase)